MASARRIWILQAAVGAIGLLATVAALWVAVTRFDFAAPSLGELAAACHRYGLATMQPLELLVLGIGTVALAAISLMLVGRVVTWDDILANKPAWNVLAWFATLVVLADGLNKVGFVGWFGKHAAALFAGHAPATVMLLLVALFFVIHYLFASLTAHTTAVLPVVFAAGLAVPDLPVRTFALLLGYSLGIMGVLTPYATGPAPVSTSGKEMACLSWLCAMMRTAPNNPRAKEEVWAEATANFPGLAKRAFDRAWTRAIRDACADAWGTPGRRRAPPDPRPGGLREIRLDRRPGRFP